MGVTAHHPTRLPQQHPLQAKSGTNALPAMEQGCANHAEARARAALKTANATSARLQETANALDAKVKADGMHKRPYIL